MKTQTKTNLQGLNGKPFKLTQLATLLALLVAFTTARATVRYVDVHSANPVPPHTTRATAAAAIQDAVDAADTGDEIMATNGIYAAGGRALYGMMTNRVAVDKLVTVRSVNGPAGTVVQGHQVPGITNGDGANRQSRKRSQSRWTRDPKNRLGVAKKRPVAGHNPSRECLAPVNGTPHAL
jgi:hypothetical protein